MDKKKLVYGIGGLLMGLAIGYWATNSLNRNFANASNTGANNAVDTAELPPGHPPAGAAGAGATAGDAGSAPGGGPQADVAATIQQARSEPANFDAQMKAAALFAQIQRQDQALEFYQKAQQLKPNDFSVLVALGNTNFDLQRFPEAERWYQAALKLRPDDVSVRADLGLSYFLREPKQIDEAIAAYRAALGYNARHEQTLQNLVTALLAKGDKVAARTYVQQLEQINPGNQALAQFKTQLN